MNAGKADSLTIADTGSTEQAVYFSEGVPKVCTNLKGIPSGGTVGQYLVKNSDNNFDVSWNSLDLTPYLTIADASGIYLSKASASTIYETKNNASNYLNKNGDTMLGTLDMNDQIITGLKEPANNTDATSKQYVDNNISTASENGLAAIRAAAPVNLLDNSDFTNPVAQASIGGNHGNQAYAIDRWILTNGSVSHTAGVGLTLNGTITQKLEHPPAGAVSAFVGMASGQASISYSGGAVTITSTGGIVAWAALYDGSYSDDTRPDYHSKGHTAELAQCQRYYHDIYLRGATGFLLDTNKAVFNLDLIEMRIANPTVQVIVGDNVVTPEGYFPVLSDGAYFDNNCCVVLLVDNSFNFPKYKPIGAFYSHIALSADL